MTGTPGEALDTDEAMRALDAANAKAQDASFDALNDGTPYEWSFELLKALNEADVVLVWDGPAKVASVGGHSEAEEAAFMAGQHAVARALIQFAKVYDLDQAVEIQPAKPTTDRRAAAMAGADSFLALMQPPPPGGVTDRCHPPQPTTDRPGGWVPGIGRVALLRDLSPDDVVMTEWGFPERVRTYLARNTGTPMLAVSLWADGTVPTEGDR